MKLEVISFSCDLDVENVAAEGIWDDWSQRNSTCTVDKVNIFRTISNAGNPANSNDNKVNVVMYITFLSPR